ncbi:MAG: cation-transporting P-type ATPase [Actinomycetota bacterium]|nr:cation-transporting P-type ATPase [Actinomycetota bacterium]
MTDPTAALTNLLLAGLALSLAAIGVSGWWVAGHREEVQGFLRGMRARPGVVRIRDLQRRAIAFLEPRVRPRAATWLLLGAGIMILALSAIAFGLILRDLVAQQEMARFDTPVLRYVATHRVRWLTQAMRMVAVLGSLPVAALVIVGLGGWYRRRTGSWEPLLILAVTSAGAMLLSLAVSEVVARARPPAAFMAIHAQGFSFPAGQAAQAALYGAVAYVVGRSLPRWETRVTMAAAAAAVSFVLGASAVYLGVHWPTDVLGGWAIAAGWLVVVLFAVTGVHKLRATSPAARASTRVDAARGDPARRVSATPGPASATGAAPPGRPRTRPEGLREGEVRERLAHGQTNRAEQRSGRTVGQILRANTFTRFNALLGSLAVVIILTGSLKDALFGLVLVANTTVGIVQELRAKRALDRLVVLAAPAARVVRDGELRELPTELVVLDDILELRTGDQIPVDGIVLESSSLEVDESLLTGEADPVLKRSGDGVLSGSFVVAGSGRVQATRVGDAAYARTLAAEGRRYVAPQSQLRVGMDRILRYVTWALVPTAALLLVAQLRARTGTLDAIRGSVAGVTGMVPEGLVLLSSTAMAVAVVRLARRRVLVQELQAVEGLARVDVLCCDKTGTITDGSIALEELLPFAGAETLPDSLGALAASTASRNATLQTLAEAFPPPPGDTWRPTATVAFSSARKWSAATFDGRGTWVLGAPEVVLAHLDDTHPERSKANQLAATGRRVLAVASSPLDPSDVDGSPHLPADLRPQGLVVFSERVRPEAAATLRYFAEQGVALKVISGDNPVTVAAVASAAGLPDAGTPQDARTLPDDPESLAQAMESNSVFGRVTPPQKRDMVRALRGRGHVVAMTGDGVNDVLALKEADLGVAMGSGTAATRAVAQAVLLDDNFAAMPDVVAEGRRVIANVERTGSLFLTKTVYVFLLALCVGLAGVAFPFLPRHLTLAGSLTIGIPGFFLALEPNSTRSRPGLLSRLLRFAVPAGSIAAAATLAAYALARQLQPEELEVARTAATITLTVCGLSILTLLARPRSPAHDLLVGLLGLGLAAALAVPFLRTFFDLHLPDAATWIAVVCVTAAAHTLLWISSRRALSS